MWALRRHRQIYEIYIEKLFVHGAVLDPISCLTFVKNLSLNCYNFGTLLYLAVQKVLGKGQNAYDFYLSLKCTFHSRIYVHTIELMKRAHEKSS